MRSIISLITAAALVLHFGLGCCAHHAHADDDCAGHAHAQPIGSHGHGQSEGAGVPGDSHESPECQEGQCVFFAGVKTTLAKEVGSHWIAPAALPAAMQIDSPDLASRAQRGSPPPLAVRRHVLHQRFLI